MTATGTCTRGTSNGNQRGSSQDRRRRREWLIETYRANVDLGDPLEIKAGLDEKVLRTVVTEVPLGEGEPACRCYRCGGLLTIETVTVDRIKPGCQGGTYKRENIRPACGFCNSSTGGRTRRKNR